MLGNELEELRRTKPLHRISIIILLLYTMFIYLGYFIPYIGSICLYLTAFCALLLVVANRGFHINLYFAWYGVFILISLVSSFAMDDVSDIYNSLYNLIIILIFSFSFSSILNKKRYIEWMFAAAELGSLLFLLYLVFTGKFFFSDTGERLGQTLTGNANTFASMYMFAACISVYFMFRLNGKKKRFGIILLFLFQMLALVLSSGRKFFLVPLLLIYILLMLGKDKYGRHHYIRYTLIAIASLAVVYAIFVNVPFFYDTIGIRFEEMLLYYTGEAEIADYSTMERIKMKQKALELWEQKPIFGYGLNAFTQIGGFGTYSHSNFTELLCNHGVIGLIYYYSYFAIMLTRAVRMKSSVTKNFIFAMLACLLIFDYGAVTYNGFFFQFMIVVVSALSECEGFEKTLEVDV